MHRYALAFGALTSLLFPVAGRASNAACTGTTATYTSRTSSSYSITFSFDRSYTCGRYANGDVWVLDPGTGVRVTAVSPTAANGRNGWIVNPTSGNTGAFKQQAFDNRVSSYNAALLPTLPVTLRAPSSVIKVASDNPAGDCLGGNATGTVDGKDDRSCVRQMAVLSIVSTAPSSEALRPPAVASAARRGQTFNYSATREGLLPSVARTSSIISQSTAEARVSQSRLLPIQTEIQADRLRPEEATPNWGTDLASADADVLLWLTSDAVATASKRATVIGLVQAGVDNWGALDAGMVFNHGGGGNQNGHYAPILFAAVMLDSAEIRSTLASNTQFYESLMLPRGNGGIALFGRRTTFISPQCQWDRWIAGSNDGKVGTCPINRDNADPYGFMDGPSVPGTSYANATAGAAKGLALAALLMPELWQEAQRAAAGAAILEYGKRSWEVGSWIDPDNCKGWPAGCTSTSCGGFGSTWGDNGAGKCIQGTPTRSDRMTRNHGDPLGTDRFSVFARDMIARHSSCAQNCSAPCPGMKTQPLSCGGGPAASPPIAVTPPASPVLLP